MRGTGYAARLHEGATMTAPIDETRDPAESLVNTAHLVYALHTLGLVIGAFGTATVIGTFLFGWPSIVAVTR